jgi:C4-type Zn-finger protein
VSEPPRRLEDKATMRLRRCPVCGRAMSLGSRDDPMPAVGSKTMCPWCGAVLEITASGELAVGGDR